MNLYDLNCANVIETRNSNKHYLFLYHNDEFIFVDLDGEECYVFNSLNSYKNSDFVIMKVYKDYTLKELLWERKEKYKSTDCERAILKNLPKEYKYIAKDKNGNLYVYKNKPIKNYEYWSDYTSSEFCFPHLFHHLFQFIKWEDKEPYLIEDLLKENKNEKEN